MNLYISNAAEGYVYQDVHDVSHAHTAIILGAKVYPSGRLSHMLEDRVLTGLELYRQGNVKKLLLSGDHGQVNYDEVNAMREYLIKHGVDARDIFMDHAGFDTYDSMYRAREVFLVRDVIVVTQKFHVARAVYIARALGLHATGVVADRRTYLSQKKSEIREILARVKAFMDVQILHAKPSYLGNIIPITGDGRSTWDE